ncbi:poly-beta-1,6-N-acetyl-D-glucosamine biosynthesis protein PgaD [Lysobacter firmicutimachus]|uniref:Poly-beta-1,6-N-acetyl-D-glucosamine biosynthesis protein PgaD n=1 Tax=Lysobacter firmicutimachus TaxID=1792846 RepID=A0ABU8D163_9GAMM
MSTPKPGQVPQRPQPRRSRRHKHDSRLIQRPYSQPLLPRTFWGLTTGAFWAIYLYLWVPLITLFMWLFGIRRTEAELYLRQHEIDPFLLLALPATAVGAATVLILWAEYNRHRFSGVERRSAPPPVALEEVAAALGASAEVAQALNQGRISTLHMDPNQAVPLGVTTVKPPPPKPLALAAPMPAFTRHTLPETAWIPMLGLAVVFVVAVLLVVSHGYRQIESESSSQQIEGAPGLDRPPLAPPQPPNPPSTSDDDTAQPPAPSADATDATPAVAAPRAQRDTAPRGASAKPRPLPGHSPKPPYPLDALRRGEGGLVSLRVRVGADGRPQRVEIGKRSGNRDLDRAAVATVRNWRFAPAKRNGRPIAAVVIVPIEFKPQR